MAFLFLLVILFFLFYTASKRPGFAIAYLLFFQILNKALFDQVGLSSFKYITFIILFPIVFFKINSKDNLKKFKRVFFTNKLVKVYFLLLGYIILYVVALGTEYEFVYLNKFIFPGIILFFSALYFFNDTTIYKDVIIGFIIFSLVTFVFLFIFKDIISMKSITRLDISEEIGIGPIAQGRIAGMLGLTILIFFFNSKKTLHKIFLLGIFSTAFIWLSLSGSRGPTLALMTMFLVYSLLNKNIIKSSIALVTISILVIPFLFYYGVFELALFERLTELSSQEDIESMKRYRRYLIFFDMPIGNFVFGLGPGGWGKHIALKDYSFPHNIIVESIVEHGIIGAIFIFTIIKTGFRQSYKKIKMINSNLYINILILWWGYYLLNTMVSGSFIQGNINFFTLTAILACIYNQKNINAN